MVILRGLRDCRDVGKNNTKVLVQLVHTKHSDGRGQDT